jgi:D-alanyl-D-alanine carboxypeptidase/D-alanyl-D-alanine-endopeptidase (penicillin-binding protein 4)
LRAASCAILFATASCGHAPPATIALRPAPTPSPFVPRPAPTWTADQRADVRRALADIFSDDITSGDGAGLVVLAADGSPLFERRATVPVAPASTLKLVVAASALDKLGPEHRFVTRFVAAAPPDPDGTLGGNLWLVGGGDPTLTSDDLRRGVGTLSRAGIREIGGALGVDDTAFSGPEQNPRWDPDDLTYDYAAGTSAISVDEDTIEFDVTPDPAGGDALVRPVPENDSITFSGAVHTASASDDTDLTIERQTQLPAFGAVANAASNDTSSEPRTEYALDGHIAQGETQKYYKPVLGIPGYVGGVVAYMLGERRIGLAGGYRAEAAPAAAVPLWTHRSGPLSDIVREMLVNSNNHTAETLLRIIGEGGGRPGTDASGVSVEKAELTKFGVPRDGLQLFDGSGLAPSDRIMPLSLAKLIASVVRGPFGDTYVRSLPLVGLEGTVKHHDLHAALGRARAKSGHIQDVNGLAGTIQTEHHGRVAFAFILNDPRADADVVYEEEDRALDLLARY